MNKCLFVIFKILELFSSLLVIIVFFIPLIIVSLFSRFFEFKGNGIFIGIHEIANNIENIQNAFDSKGFQTNSIIEPNKFYTSGKLKSQLNKSTRICLVLPGNIILRNFYKLYKKFLLPILLFYQIYRNRTWIFVWNKTFLPLNLDLIILRLSGKKIIMFHCGDDVRYRPMQAHINNVLNIDILKNCEMYPNFLKNFWFVWISEKTADQILSCRDQSTFQQVPYNHFKFPMMALDPVQCRKNSTVKIVHAPSDRSVKGTEVVLKVINNLSKNNINFEFVLLENKSNEFVLKELQTADILIDQPGVWVARLALEGCASRCAVIGGNNPSYVGMSDSPIIQFERTPESLYSVLFELINDSTLLNEKKNACYQFWYKNYSYESFFNYFNQVVENKAQKFLPLFNQKKYLLESSENWFQWFIVKIFYNPL